MLNSNTELLYLGREYPLGFSYFRRKVYLAFMAKASLQDEVEILEAIRRAEYVKAEIETL